jgi:hypothetical protein
LAIVLHGLVTEASRHRWLCLGFLVIAAWTAIEVMPQGRNNARLLIEHRTGFNPDTVWKAVD